MTAGELRAALDGVPDSMDVILRLADEDGNTYLAALNNAEACAGCTETLAMMLDGEIDGDPMLTDDHADGAP